MFVELVCISTNIKLTVPHVYASLERSIFCLSIDIKLKSLGFISIKINSFG